MAVSLLSCGAREDTVFTPIRLSFEQSQLFVAEDGGLAELSLRLSAPSSEPVSAPYRLRGVEAQGSCPERDFEVSSGRVVFAPGQVVATVAVLVIDDDLAETDESLLVELGVPEGAVLDGASTLSVVITDDDRTQLIDAALDYAVTPGSDQDSGPALQAALAAAAQSGRGVVVVAPGDYELGSLDIPVGTTLSARGALFHRPALADADTVTFRVSYSGPEDSLPSLLEGASIDGRRDEQGEFRSYELQDASLLHISADPLLPGRVRVTVEGLELHSATGDGLTVRDNADVNVCGVTGKDLWRELLSVGGGNIRLVAAELAGSANEGTTGLWFGSAPTGYEGSGVIEAELDDVTLSSGDFELVLDGGSRFSARHLRMDQAPLRISAADSTVRISDSVLVTGVLSERHNYFRVPHDVEIRNSVVVLSERIDEQEVTQEAARALVFAAVSYSLEPDMPTIPGPHRLLFEHCQFLLAPDVETSDSVSVVSAEPGGSVLVSGSSFGPGISGWFSDSCADCELSP